MDVNEVDQLPLDRVGTRDQVLLVLCVCILGCGGTLLGGVGLGTLLRLGVLLVRELCEVRGELRPLPQATAGDEAVDGAFQLFRLVQRNKLRVRVSVLVQHALVEQLHRRQRAMEAAFTRDAEPVECRHLGRCVTNTVLHLERLLGTGVSN